MKIIAIKILELKLFKIVVHHILVRWKIFNLSWEFYSSDVTKSAARTSSRFYLLIVRYTVLTSFFSMLFSLQYVKDPEVCRKRRHHHTQSRRQCRHTRTCVWDDQYVSDFKLLALFIYFLLSINVLFSSSFLALTDQEKVSDYEMKLMDLDVEQLGIPVSHLWRVLVF